MLASGSRLPLDQQGGLSFLAKCVAFRVKRSLIA